MKVSAVFSVHLLRCIQRPGEPSAHSAQCVCGVDELGGLRHLIIRAFQKMKGLPSRMISFKEEKTKCCYPPGNAPSLPHLPDVHVSLASLLLAEVWESDGVQPPLLRRARVV